MAQSLGISKILKPIPLIIDYLLPTGIYSKMFHTASGGIF